MIEYDEKMAAATERNYLMPEIVNQRSRTMAALQLQAGERVLDIGCGMGLLARDMGLAVGKTGKIVGLDNSEPMIALAEKRCASYPQIELRVASAADISEPPDHYDAATCTQVLLYVEEPQRVLNQIYQVLKPGGRAAVLETDWQGSIFNTMDRELTRELFTAWEKAIPSPNLPAKLPGMLRQAGFQSIRVEAIPIINTSYLPGNYSVGMVKQLLEMQIDSGTITQSQADAYLADLKQKGEAGEYFFCVNRFLFMARK